MMPDPDLPPVPAAPEFSPAALTAWRGYIGARDGDEAREGAPPTRAEVLAHQNGDTLESFVLLEAQDVALGHGVASQALEEVQHAMTAAIADLEGVSAYLTTAIAAARDFEQFAASAPAVFAAEWAHRMTRGDVASQAAHLQQVWDRATPAQRRAVPTTTLTPFLTHGDAAVRARAVTMAADMAPGPTLDRSGHPATPSRRRRPR